MLIAPAITAPLSFTRPTEHIENECETERKKAMSRKKGEETANRPMKIMNRSARNDENEGEWEKKKR